MYALGNDGNETIKIFLFVHPNTHAHINDRLMFMANDRTRRKPEEEATKSKHKPSKKTPQRSRYKRYMMFLHAIGNNSVFIDDVVLRSIQSSTNTHTHTTIWLLWQRWWVYIAKHVHVHLITIKLRLRAIAPLPNEFQEALHRVYVTVCDLTDWITSIGNWNYCNGTHLRSPYIMCHSPFRKKIDFGSAEYSWFYWNHHRFIAVWLRVIKLEIANWLDHLIRILNSSSL